MLHGAVVKTLLDDLPLDSAATALGPVGQVTVLIRPEKIDLSPAASEPAADDRTIVVRVVGGHPSRPAPR